MQGEPFENAKKACQLIVRNLRPGDGFSLIAFDDTAHVVIPFDRVRDTQKLVDVIARLQVAGSTNLTAGWMLGRDELKKAERKMRRRLVLLTDGHLNVGVTEPTQVAQIVTSGLELDRVTTTTVGFGLNYDEQLLSELSKVSRGNFHDADSPEKLPLIFAQELDGLKAITAQNVRIRVGAMDCCERWAQLSDYPQVRLPDGRTEIAIGDLTSGEERALVLMVDVMRFPDPGAQMTTLQDGPLMKVEVLWDEMTAARISSASHEQLIRVSATQNPKDVRVNEQTVSWIAVQRAGKALAEATEAARNNKVDEAKKKLQEALESILAYKLDDKIQDGLKILQDFLKRLSETGGFGAKDMKQANYSAKYMTRPSTAISFTSGSATKPTFSQRQPMDDQLKEQRRKSQPPTPSSKKSPK